MCIRYSILFICRIFVNRDVNACKNILLIAKTYLLEQRRPNEFKRQIINSFVIKKERKKRVKKEEQIVV
jgi:hypothetical protein